MFNIKEKIDEVVDNAENVARTYYKLGVLNAIDKGSKIGSILIVSILSLFLVFIFLIFVLFGCAYWIGEALQNIKLGFFIVAGLTLLLTLLIVALNKKLVTPWIRNIIIEQLNDDEDDAA
ncbi:MAG: phage holin family protein [Bacteroidia bacterium]|nr:MAG: phage holin family protein [Bacteroidia bacterium]